jgi:RimJ/RimL family protein N-acetyltransferase
MLEGEKVLLRPVRRADISDFLRWFNDPEVIQYLRIYLPMTEMAEEKWIEELDERSLKLHKKVGFKEEGCRRKAVYKNGQYSDVIEFGILREEW